MFLWNTYTTSFAALSWLNDSAPRTHQHVNIYTSTSNYLFLEWFVEIDYCCFLSCCRQASHNQESSKFETVRFLGSHLMLCKPSNGTGISFSWSAMRHLHWNSCDHTEVSGCTAGPPNFSSRRWAALRWPSNNHQTTHIHRFHMVSHSNF